MSRQEKKPASKATFLMKLSVCVMAVTGTLYFLSQYRDWAKTTREISVDSNEPILAVSSNTDLDDDLEFRQQIRERDKALLDALDRKRTRFEHSNLESVPPKTYARNYLQSLLAGAQNIAPEAAALRDDFHRRLADPDLQHAVPPNPVPARVAAGQ